MGRSTGTVWAPTRDKYHREYDDAPRGVWLGASERLSTTVECWQTYPCNCPQVRKGARCAGRSGNWPCDCSGRIDGFLDDLPDTCCARARYLASLSFDDRARARRESARLREAMRVEQRERLSRVVEQLNERQAARAVLGERGVA